VTEPLPASGRVTLVLTSPRAAVGLLTGAAWERLRAADTVLAADPDPGWLEVFEPAGIEIVDVGDVPIGERAGRLVQDAATGLELVWWGSPDGDPGLTDALAEHLSRRAVAGHPPEVEVLTGSYDVPGSRVLDLVSVMETLRSPEGSAWDREQTHVSLLPFLLEEAHEVIEAIESGDRAHLAEELGDLLLQVVFHAQVASEDESAPFDLDQVAAGIVAKLIRRNPHVFGNQPVAGGRPDEEDQFDEDQSDEDQSDEDQSDGVEMSAAEVSRRWEELKAAEKPQRRGFDGIPVSLPALARAQKMLVRWQQAGSPDALPAAIEKAAAGDELAQTLLRAVEMAQQQGRDAEALLRAALGRLAQPD